MRIFREVRSSEGQIIRAVLYWQVRLLQYNYTNIPMPYYYINRTTPYRGHRFSRKWQSLLVKLTCSRPGYEGGVPIWVMYGIVYTYSDDAALRVWVAGVPSLPTVPSDIITPYFPRPRSSGIRKETSLLSSVAPVIMVSYNNELDMSPVRPRFFLFVGLHHTFRNSKVWRLEK